MKLCRFQPLLFSPKEINSTEKPAHPAPRYGIVDGERVSEIVGDIFDVWTRTAHAWPLQDVKLLPPSTPGKIVCVGRNYREHAAELGNEVPKEPLIFLKPSSSVIAPEEPILLPPISKRVDYEGELAVVIGRRCARLAPGEAVEPYILGYTCLNDVTARDLQRADVQFTRAKGFDTFCPFGPVLATELDFASARVETFVNGSRRHSRR